MPGGKPFDIEAIFWKENDTDYHSYFVISDIDKYGVFEITSKFINLKTVSYLRTIVLVIGGVTNVAFLGTTVHKKHNTW